MLRDSACWGSGAITQPRTNFFGQLCTVAVGRRICEYNSRSKTIHAFENGGRVYQTAGVSIYLKVARAYETAGSPRGEVLGPLLK